MDDIIIQAIRKDDGIATETSGTGEDILISLGWIIANLAEDSPFSLERYLEIVADFTRAAAHQMGGADHE